MKKISLLLSLILFSFNLSWGKLKVVATTQDLAAIAGFIGGDKIELSFIAKGYQDPHFVEAKPSYLLKLRGADLLIAVGLELEIGWLPVLVRDSRNPKILAGKGYLDASTNCEILEKRAGQVTRAAGDIHPFGNPHFWLDPNNGKIIAQNIARRLSELDPANTSFYQTNLDNFVSKLAEKQKQWEGLIEPYRGTKIVTYHNSWPNFAKYFGLEVIGYVEPKPGIPPSPSHTLKLIQLMKSNDVKIILMEPYFDIKTPQSIAQKAQAKVVVLPPSVGGEKEITDYFSLFDYDLNLLIKTFIEVGIAR
ncbi:MAG: hypothetical protein RBG1_1C00001G0108 [candidate division Zixibacteria bacterium RBG-1]|nr:MAG: hypothetical protein RBG1_1C00001G0108 [candidate division Zixibacteria bacterium RBG-1]